MPKQYILHLKGFVGGSDFDADYVDYILANNKDQDIRVLIDSFGGQVSTALSISSAFRRHGRVHAHFVGMNASAATIASLGAQRITIDASAMYLVHKCSMGFFRWGSMNADDLASLIANIEKQKADLDKLDANIADMYARKCKKPAADLLALMQKGGWLTAQEALDWGFVDEITDDAEDAAPVLTDSVVNAMNSAGIPIPKLPHQQEPTESAINKLAKFFTAFFSKPHAAEQPVATEPEQPQEPEPTNEPTNDQATKPTNDQTNKPNTMKIPKIQAALGLDTVPEGNITLTAAQAEQLEAHITNLEDSAKAPGDTTRSVVDTKKDGTPDAPEDDVQAFVKTANSARALFNELP